jgi:hypothetical protein
MRRCPRIGSSHGERHHMSGVNGQGTSSSSNWKNLGMVTIATVVILHSEATWRD